MPLHLESFITEDKSNNTLSVMLEGVRTAEPLYISKDETIVHSRKRMKDTLWRIRSRRKPVLLSSDTIKISTKTRLESLRRKN